MRDDDFLVFEISEININGDLDISNEEPEYLCLMRTDVKQLRFFEWYYNKITYPFIKQLKKRYNPQDVVDTVDDEKSILIWGDSGIP